MRTLILLLILSISSFRCSKEEIEEQQASIYGTWQLIEIYSGPPSGEGWSDVDNGYTYEITHLPHP